MSAKITRSRTLTVSDEEWSRLTALAKVEGRTITRQVIHMSETTIAALDPAQSQKFDEALNA